MVTIKKIILLVFTTLMMVSCYNNQNDIAKSVEERDFGVCVFDSCEYLIRSSGYKGYLAHKGNCRFCKERRQKELEGLVEQLKINNYDNN